eukprot:6819733-Pyramimonas_sp.AAC.2
MAQIVYDTHETCLLRGSECAAPALKPLLLAGRPGVVERLKEAGVAFDWDHTMDPAEASDLSLIHISEPTRPEPI